MAAQVIEMLTRTHPGADVSDIRGWAGQVGRFLLKGPSLDGRLGDVPPISAPAGEAKITGPMAAVYTPV